MQSLIPPIRLIRYHCRWPITLLCLGAILSLTWAKSAAQSAELRYGDTVKGTLTADATQDWFFVATPGDRVSIDVVRTSGNLLPGLLLLDQDGQTLLGTQASADQSGQTKLSLFSVRIAQPGSYTIRVSSMAHTVGDYSLTLNGTLSPAQPSPTPIVRSVAGTLQYGDTVHGAISGVIYEQFWRFKGNAGDVIDIKMIGTTGTLDPFLSLLSPANDVITTNDSADGGKDAGIYSQQLPATGSYTIISRRSGAQQGQSGLTTGEYDLTLTIHTPDRGDQNTTLALGSTITGRLTTAFPLAEYRILSGGALALTVNLASLHRLARVRILDAQAVPVVIREGLSPLAFSTSLPDKGPYFIQVSSDIFDDQKNTDFALSVYKLTSPANPLRYFEAQHSNLDGTDQRWFFTAHAGDLVRVRIQPSDGSLNTRALITGPQDIVLFQGNIGPQFDQPLTLPANGVYQVTVQAVDKAVPPVDYQIEADWFGAAGIPFAQFGASKPKGSAALDTPLQNTLAPGSVDSWTLDAAANQVISLSVKGSTSTQPLGVAVRAPDETLIGVQVGQGLILLKRVLLPGDGRYQIIVFDPTNSAKDPYTLRLEDAGGGDLPIGQPVKGVLLPTNAFAEWSFNVPTGALINTRLTTRTPGIWTPNIYTIDPSGFIIAHVTAGVDQNGLSLLGVTAPIAGRYRLIVAGSIAASFASYELLTDVQTPFSGGTSIRIQPSLSPPMTRFVPAPSSAVQTLSVADLIEPPLPPEKLNAPDVPLLSANTLVRGEIAPGALRQAWHFLASTNTTISLQATAFSGTGGPDLTLLDRDGKILTEALHGDAPGTTLTYHVVQGGDYLLVVRMGLAAGRYTLLLMTPSLNQGALTVAQGTPIIYGQSLSGELLTPAQTDAYYFLGAANDVITAQVTRATGDLVTALQLITPSGKALANDSNSAAQGSSTIRDVRLPEVGIYTIRVQHNDATTQTTGRYQVYLGITSGSRLKSRVSGVISPGQTVTGALLLADNEDTWLLQGHAGERVSLVASSLESSVEPTPLGLRLQDTTGNTFAAQDVALSQDAARLDQIMLPSDGIYRVQVIGGGQTPGAYRLSWLAERERLHPGALHYAQTVSGVFTANHNADSWTFSGTANDVIAVSMRSLRGEPFKGGFQLLSENGVALVVASDLGDGKGARADGITLPFSGSYTIIAVNPDAAYQGAGVYALNVILQDSQARSIGAVLHDGEQGAGDLYPDDPTDTWLFSGRTGDVVNIQLQAQDQFLKPQLKLQNTFGQVLISVQPDAVLQSTINSFKLPADGVYVLAVSGVNGSTGSYRIGLNFVPPPIPDIATIQYGDTVVGLVADDRPIDLHLFSGQQGDRITAKALRESGSQLATVLELRTAQGALLARADALNDDEAVINDFALPESGSYRLITTRYQEQQGRSAGRFTLALSAQAATHPIRSKLLFGLKGISRVDDATPSERWIFDGKAGEVIGITSKATSGDLDTYLTLLSPDGQVIATNDDYQSTDAVLTGVLLPTDGTYTVLLSRVGTRSRGSAGNYELRADRLYTLGKLMTPQALIGYGQRVVGIVDLAHAETRWTFSGNRDDEIALQLVHPTDDVPPLLSIQDPTGGVLATGKLGVGQTTIDRFRLPARGFFEIVVKRPSNAHLAYNPYALTLTLLTSPISGPSSGGTLQANDIVTGSLSAGQNANFWLLKGSAGQMLSVELLALTGDLAPSLLLIGPGGQALVTQSTAAGAAAALIDGVPLSLDGIYTLAVLPGAANRAGTYRLSVRSTVGAAADVRPITPGQNVQGALSDVHLIERWAFKGSKGDAVSARMLTISGDLQPSLQLVSADGQILAQSRLDRTPFGDVAAIDQALIPADGTYQWVAMRDTDNQRTTSGAYVLSFDLKALSAKVLAATPIRYGQTVQSVVEPSQTALWTFDGKAGDAINAVALPGKTGDVPSLALQDAAGQTLFQADAANQETDLQGVVLPADGRYVLALKAARTSAYSLTLQRRQDTLPAKPTGRALVNGTLLENGLLGSTIFDYWTFSGKAEDVIQIAASQLNSSLRLDVSIYGPNGYLNSATANAASSAVRVGPLRLPDTGTYLVVVGRWLGAAGKTTGRYTILLSNADAADVPAPTAAPSAEPSQTMAGQASEGRQPGAVYQGEIAVGGAAEGFLEAGQTAQEWSFVTKRSPTIAVTLKSLSAGLQAAVLIVRADGTLIGKAHSNRQGDLVLEAALPDAGRYAVLVMPGAPGQQGRYTFQLHYALAPTGGGVLVDDQLVRGTISSADFTDCWRFEAKAGSHMALDLTRLAGDLDAEITLISPDGSSVLPSPVAATTDSSGALHLPETPLVNDGVYLLIVSRQGGAKSTATGDYQLQVHLTS